ncbi:MAG: cupin domain-containing protein [Pseudomonadales bacterium]|nr:cupin domain-containing protein [Pseudomonadales bacterium]
MNFFEAQLPGGQSEHISELLKSDLVRVERIVSCGHCSPAGFWYDQEEHEWVLLVQGAGIIEFADGRQVRLNKGDHLDIPAHVKHRVAWTQPDCETLWLAVFWSAQTRAEQRNK